MLVITFSFCYPKITMELFTYYSLIPIKVIRNPKLSPGAKAVYLYLLGYVNLTGVKKGEYLAWPSRKRITSELSISPNTLTKYLRELEEQELIEIERRKRKLPCGKKVYANNVYRFNRGALSFKKKLQPEELVAESKTGIRYIDYTKMSQAEYWEVVRSFQKQIIAQAKKGQRVYKFG